jgi:DNA-binding CsgD family transcriptional regulator
MGISLSGVKQHRAAAALALGAENCLHAVVRAMAGGIFTLEDVT